MTFLGTFIWALAGMIFLSYNVNYADQEILNLFLLSVCILFTYLITVSIKRGTALSFFLWGLSVPTLAASLLKLAFLFGYPEK